MIRLALLALAGAACGAAAAQAPPARPAKRAACVVDARPVTVMPAALSVAVNDAPHYFCSPACRDRFVTWPEKYLRGAVVACTVQPNFKGHIDLPRRVALNNNLYYLCCAPCTGFLRDQPHLYLKEVRDPVSGRAFRVTEGVSKSIVKQQVFLFESAETRAAFEKEPDRFILPFHR